MNKIKKQENKKTRKHKEKIVKKQSKETTNLLADKKSDSIRTEV
jgi:hypothetical protein